MPSGPAGPIVECVPNVSEGRDPAVVARLAEAIVAPAGVPRVSAPGVRLMNVHRDPDHHRSVFSFLGAPEAVEAAARALARAVFAAVDMRAHRGLHPRVGALDVLPFVPLAGISMAETVELARRVGQALGREHGVPVYYYGEAATRAARRRLAELRHGEYEGLAARLATPEGAPDDGPARFDARAGAVLVGARRVLVAFNVWLESADLAIARAVARAVRESSGGLPAVQALGLFLAGAGRTQVSMNLVDHEKTPIPTAYDRVREEAARRGVAVAGAELVGVAPAAAFAGRTPASVGLADFTRDLLLDVHLEALGIPLP